MVLAGSFRQDLYYRINVIELALPPLRGRSEDIALITARLLQRLARTNGVDMPTLSPAALQALQRYHFPGNVRELENILERAIALHEHGVIEAGDLSLSSNFPSPATTSTAPVNINDFNAEQMSLESYLLDIEKKALSTALEQNRWNKTAAAKQLGMTFRSFRYRLKKLGLE